MKRILKLVVVTVLAVLVQGLCLAGTIAQAYGINDEWLIYWYVCGSDLESDYGVATEDIAELLDANLPPNVKVLIQTGGSRDWQNDAIPKNNIGRYLYDQDGLHELALLPDSDMGSKDTLQNFLQYGKDNFSADHRVFIFWNHGGGSTGGICIDERTDNALSLNDVHDAFAAVHTPSAAQPPFELVGFDACLMATYDMANALHGLSRYMTASEENEASNGWYYGSWVGALGRNPAMDGAVLGKIICDSYMEGCRRANTAATATLSCIDLSQMPALRSAYEAYGIEALRHAKNNPQRFFSALGRAAKNTENYGGNTRDQGYANMVDLGDLANETTSLLPDTAQNLARAVNNAVVYNVHGAYRKYSHGLSSFYPYSGDSDDLVKYADQNAAPLPQKCLYYYLLSNEFPAEAEQLIAGYTPAAPAQTHQGNQKIFDIASLEDTPVHIDSDGISYVKLNQEQMDLLASVHCQLVYIDKKEDILLALGSDTNIIADWDTGIMKDNFNGKWPMLNGHPVYIEITAEKDDYNVYSVPIKLNGTECNLQVIYNYNTERYHIIGARKGIDNHGMGDRNLIQIKPGDKITTIHYGMTLSGNDTEFTPVEVDTFTVGQHLTMEDLETGDGVYGYFFEFVTPQNESAMSNMVTFTIKDQEITTST